MRAWHDRLHDWMNGAGLNEGDLAARCGVHPRTVFRWRSGESPPSAEARQKLAELGAPLPPKAAAGKPPASERIEGRLVRIEAQLGQVLELLTRRG